MEQAVFQNLGLPLWAAKRQRLGNTVNLFQDDTIAAF